MYVAIREILSFDRNNRVGTICTKKKKKTSKFDVIFIGPLIFFFFIIILAIIKLAFVLNLIITKLRSVVTDYFSYGKERWQYRLC